MRASSGATMEERGKQKVRLGASTGYWFWKDEQNMELKNWGGPSSVGGILVCHLVGVGAGYRFL